MKPLSMLIALVLFLVSCSGDGADPDTDPGPTPAPKREYVVITSLKTHDNFLETYDYDTAWNLTKVDLEIPPAGFTLVADSLAFSYDADGLPLKVTGGHRSFSDIGDPTENFNTWFHEYTFQQPLPEQGPPRVTAMARNLRTRTEIFFEEVSDIETVNRQEMEWDGEHLARRVAFGNDGTILHEIAYDYSEPDAVILRLTYPNDPNFDAVAYIYRDETDRVVEIETVWPHREIPGFTEHRQQFSYADGEGKWITTYAHTDANGTVSEGEWEAGFTYDLVEEPGWAAYVLDPEQGPKAGSIFYIPYGYQSSSASEYTLFGSSRLW